MVVLHLKGYKESIHKFFDVKGMTTKSNILCQIICSLEYGINNSKCNFEKKDSKKNIGNANVDLFL